MSCQQASRLITTTVTAIGTAAIHNGANANSKLTATQEDPYVFTDTVSNTPPILFNTQKSRARANEAQHKNNSNTKQTTIATSVATTTTTAAANTKAAESIVSAKAAVPLAQLNGIITTATGKRGATGAATKPIGGVGALKAQASMVVVAKTQPTTTTNFNNVTQSQIQLQQQAQNKRATNVCIVRPQLQKQQQQQQQQQSQHQQHQQQQQQHQQQQQQSAQQQHQLLKPAVSLPPPPPPLYSHTPSLWQTPLLLDTAATTTVKLQLPISPIAAAAVTPPLQVSPPTSPASLPSPNASSRSPSPASLVTLSSPATVTAMVAPIVVPPVTAAAISSTVVVVGGQPLPPSKFHHTTLAQHLQKVECLKKPKRNALSLASSNNDMINTNHVESSPKRTVRLAQPPPLKAFDLATTIITPTTIQHKHSADDDNDLNEIPVNVIFRKPLASEMPLGEQNAIVAVDTHKSPKSVKIIPNLKVAVAPFMPPTPPTPPMPPATTKQITNILDLGTFNVSQPHPTNVNKASVIPQNVPVIKSVVIPEAPSQVPLQLQKPPQQTSSIAAAAAKRKTPATGSKTNTNKKSGKKNMLKAIVGPTETATDASPVVPVALTTAVTGTIAPLQNPNVAKHKINTVESMQSPAKTSMPPMSMPQIIDEDAVISKTESDTSSILKSVKFDNMLAYVTKDDNSVPSNSSDLPYCIQRHWMHARDLNISTSHGSSSNCREERIAEHKSLLRRQALQLLATRSLQKMPITLARQRLQCVDRMLHKYQNRCNEQQLPAKKCLFSTCTEPTLTMASHCLHHIVNNITQQIFVPCVAKFSNGQICRAPVFDIMHDVALCTMHKCLRNDYDQRKNTIAHNEQHTAPQQQLQQQELLPKVQQQAIEGHQQHQQQRLPLVTITEVPPNMVVTGTLPNNNVIVTARKRKANNGTGNPVGRPQKRAKKQLMTPQPVVTAAVVQPVNLPPISAVLQRKSSTTSLESITSNSQSSNSQAQYNAAPVLSSSNNNSSTPFASLPALAPLSNVHNILLPMAAKNDVVDSINTANFGNLNAMISTSFKGDDLNQIAAQLTCGVNHNNNNITNNYNNNMNYVNGNFPTTLNPFNGIGIGSVSDMGVGNTLVNTNDLLTQDMFSICENSSAYASSEDTGLGGISESELIGSHEADDIPLVDTRLLEEHDLANVLSTLPVDAFNELFTSVRQDESDEMDRQLELADKHIRCLQQSIGSDSDFLGDFLDVNDDILADSAADICNKMDIVSSVMNSPETSGIDAATLFVDSNGAGSNSGVDSSGSGGGNGSQSASTTGTACPSIADIRGLVQA